MRVKPGASLAGVDPVVRLYFPLIDGVARIATGRPATITSGTDNPGEVHKAQGLHPVGRALDLRAAPWHGITDDQARTYARYLDVALGPGWGVILERYADDHAEPEKRGKVSHIHVEYDPKGAALVALLVILTGIGAGVSVVSWALLALAAWAAGGVIL